MRMLRILGGLLLLNTAGAREGMTPAEHDIARWEMVNQINSNSSNSWTAAFHPRFKGHPLGWSMHANGVLPGNKGAILEKVRNGDMKMFKRNRTFQLPESFDSAKEWAHCAKIIGDIRDQSSTDCCWAFAAAEVASDRICIATGGTVMVPLSAKEMCFCPTAYGAARGCNGGQTWAAWDYIQYDGLATGNGYDGSGAFSNESLCSQWPFPICHHYGPRTGGPFGADPYPQSGGSECPSCDETPACPDSCDSGAKAPYNDFDKYRYSFSGDYNSIDSDADAIAEQIMKFGPVQAAYTVAEDFENYQSGIYHPVSGAAVGGHSVKIVGWGVENGIKYWKVANSWNKYWGEGGYFRILRGEDICGIEDEVIATDGDVQWTGPGIKDGGQN